MSKKCKQCQGVYILSSRFRWSDLPAFFLLFKPVRCAYCGQRQYKNILPVVGRLYRLTVFASVFLVAGGLYYTRVLDRPLPSLEVLKIEVSKVWNPGQKTQW